MNKNMIKALALVSMVAGSCLQAGVTFYNDSDRLVRVEGFGSMFWPVQAHASREFHTGLQNTVIIKGRNSEESAQYGDYKFYVSRSIRNQKEQMGRAGERVHFKKAFFDGRTLKVEGRIGKDDQNTMFPIEGEPVRTKRVSKKTKTKTKTKTKYVSENR